MLARVLRALAVPFFVALAALPAAAMSVRPATFDELVDYSNLVIEGEVTANWSAKDESGMIVTYTTFALRDVIVGAVPKSTYTIKQIGGAAEGVEYRVRGIPMFEVGKTYVVFLPGRSSAGFSSPVAMSQGSFSVGSSQRVANGRDFRDMIRTIPSGQLPSRAAAALTSQGPVYSMGLADFKELVRARAGRARQ